MAEIWGHNCKEERGGDSFFLLSRQMVKFGMKGFDGEQDHLQQNLTLRNMVLVVFRQLVC